MGKVHLITGYKGEEHIKSADHGSFNASFFGGGEYVMEAGNQLEASIMDNNTVRILDGDLLMQGRHIRIEPDTYEDMTITTGTAGVNRIDLIVMQYSKDTSTDIESAELVVIKGTETEGTATMPEYTSGDILQGATFNQMPLYSVKVEGVVLTKIEPLFVVIPTYKTLAEQYAAEFQKACESHLDSLNVLDTMEEVEANTQENQLAGALAVKEVIKYKMANTSGLASNERGLIVLNDWDLYQIGHTGMYYIVNGTNIPSGVSANGYLFAMIHSNEFRQIMYMPYGTNRLFVNQMVNGAWVGWEEYAQYSELNKKASNLVYSVAVGETLTILNGELPGAYICATKGPSGTAQSVIVGSGYGATSVRHKITELISGASIAYAVNETVYGLSITNNSTGAISVGITAIVPK